MILREQETEAGYWLPVSALVAGERGLWSLYVVKPTENNAYQVVRRGVEIIHSDAERALVRGSIESGDRVITPWQPSCRTGSARKTLSLNCQGFGSYHSLCAIYFIVIDNSSG